jgi:hypothetical protein
MRPAAAGRREGGGDASGGRREHVEIGVQAPRHMAARLRVLGFTGWVTGCRCNPFRSSDPQNLPVQGGIPGVVAVSLRS